MKNSRRTNAARVNGEFKPSPLPVPFHTTVIGRSPPTAAGGSRERRQFRPIAFARDNVYCVAVTTAARWNRSVRTRTRMVITLMPRHFQKATRIRNELLNAR